MHRRIITIRLLALLSLTICNVKLPAQQAENKLQHALEKMIKSFKGTAGVYVYNLKTGEKASVNADTIFPTASIVKVPILVGLFDKIDQGEFKYHEELVYHDSIKYGGSGLMQFFKDSTKTDLSTLAALMITYSDNTTSLWCQSLAGGGEAINHLMDDYGFPNTKVNSRTKGREEIWKKYGWGQTTPREMAKLLIKIRNGEIINPAASERMYRLLTNIYYDEYALSQIPPYIQTASKQGMVNDSRSELFMVNAPSGDYVCYIATKNLKDQSWKVNNEAWKLARKISAYLWNYFEPESDWKPAKGVDKFAEGMRY
ncbi:serine hydrolase [Olivibacter sp. SDN3]|uniref:serine hydrolase n=1 Tax=Olivibacter sp. SDN3 TaxID=2764720 RepID=UPI0016510AC1|nr:serine hydrolase [Olivibacter sp. SDN3]QNL48683.1 serine hydrolase [Olivibacter sp. SDN3]